MVSRMRFLIGLTLPCTPDEYDMNLGDDAEFKSLIHGLIQTSPENEDLVSRDELDPDPEFRIANMLGEEGTGSIDDMQAVALLSKVSRKLQHLGASKDILQQASRLLRECARNSH